MNKVVLTGRITKDPEIRYTTTGIGTVSFSVAVDRPMATRDASGNRPADFINCVAWRAQADFITRFIKKGYMLCVEGSIQTRNYQNKDGQTVYITEVVVDQVENLQPRDQSERQNSPTTQTYAPNTFNNPSYGSTKQVTKAPAAKEELQESFSIDVADDDLPF